MSGTDRVRAHAALWYADARYRLAWLVLPQAAIALAAGLALAVLKPTGEWGKPADSKEDEKLYHELLDKAGKDGDKAAFDKLKAGADAGNISARSFLGTLYNPEWASLYPKSPVKADAAKALTYYQQPADLGYPGAQRHDRTAAQSRARSVRPQAGVPLRPRLLRKSGRDPGQPLRFLVDAVLDRRLLYRLGQWRAARHAEGADIYMDTVAAKLPLSVTTFTDDLGRQPPDLVAAIQRNLARRGFYSGPADGSATPQTLAAVRALAGKCRNGRRKHREACGQHAAGTAIRAEAERRGTHRARQERDHQRCRRGEAPRPGGRRHDGRAVPLRASFCPRPTRSSGSPPPMPPGRYSISSGWRARRPSPPPRPRPPFLYDIGAPNLPRDPEKAADMTIRALELKDADILKNIEEDKWGAGFWAALQQRLAQRNLYQGRILDQRNDRTVQAARSLLGKQ